MAKKTAGEILLVAARVGGMIVAAALGIYFYGWQMEPLLSHLPNPFGGRVEQAQPAPMPEEMEGLKAFRFLRAGRMLVQYDAHGRPAQVYVVEKDSLGGDVLTLRVRGSSGPITRDIRSLVNLEVRILPEPSQELWDGPRYRAAEHGKSPNEITPEELASHLRKEELLAGLRLHDTVRVTEPGEKQIVGTVGFLGRGDYQAFRLDLPGGGHKWFFRDTLAHSEAVVVVERCE